MVGAIAIDDPTQTDGQGNDKGNNYRSAIYWTNDEQKQIALSTKDEYQALLNKKGFGEIVTELKPLDKFWQAEGYHQNYLAKNPNGYCPNHKTGVKFANKGMIKEKLSGTYNEHLQGLILKPLGGKEIIVIESNLLLAKIYLKVLIRLQSLQSLFYLTMLGIHL
jgi:peptide methionine sulfoxide reductase msrA/msrB